MVRGSAHREEDKHSCATHCLNIGMVFGKRTLHSGGLSHQNRTTDVHCSLPRRAHLHRLRLRPWSPSTRQNRAGPARANSLQPRWHRISVCHRPLISAPLSRLQAVSAGTLLRLAHLTTINHRLGTRFCRGSLFDRRLWSIASSGVCDEDQLDRTFSKSPGQSACSTAKHLWKRSRSQQSPPG